MKEYIKYIRCIYTYDILNLKKIKLYLAYYFTYN